MRIFQYHRSTEVVLRMHLLLQSLTLGYNAKRKNQKKTLLMCTQREILQNDLLRSAKLGPWQKEKQQLKMGVLFYFSVFSVVFPPYSFFFFLPDKKRCSLVSDNRYKCNRFTETSFPTTARNGSAIRNATNMQIEHRPTYL